MARSPRRFAELLQEGVAAVAARSSKPKGVIHDELGYAIGRNGGSAIEYWAYGDGHIPTNQTEVVALARVLMDEGKLDQGWLTAFLESAGYVDRAELLAELFPAMEQGKAKVEPPPAELSLPIDVLPPPAPLPVGSIMPLSRNPLFVGREEDLRSVARTLSADKAAAVGQVDTTATTGLGGMGKTQLACEFVHRYGQFFPGGVFWLSFDSAESVPAEIAGCGGSGALDLHPDFGQRSLAEQVRLVQKAWQEPVPRLLVFDNCEVLDLLTQWRPTSGGCRILITSRRGDWEPALGVTMLALDVLSRAESLTLLRSHCPQADEEVLDTIAEELGDLPLALHLAGSYLRRYPHVAPDAYLAQLRDPQLLHHPSMQGEGFSPTGHIQHVGRTFALSYDRLDPGDETDARAIKLLVHAAHFAPGEPIWYQLLVRTLGLDLDDPDDAHRADGAFARLIELGIIEREENDTLRMHRLVARFVRDVAKDEVEATQKAVEAVVFEETASVNREVRPMPLLAWQLHLRSVADIAQVREDEESARLCHELGTHLWQIGDYEGALRYAEKSHLVREELFGKDHLDVAESLTLLGRIYRALGKFADTKPYFERALAIRQKYLDSQHELIAESLQNLGRCHQELNQLHNAMAYLQQALEMYQQVLGKEHELVAECHNNVGTCSYTMGDHEKALSHLKRAAAINEKVLGIEHPHVAVNYHNLGTILRRLGRLEEAKSFIDRALLIRYNAYGNEHPNTINSLLQRGIIWRELGQLEQAITDLEDALFRYVRLLGEEHISTADSHCEIAKVHHRRGHLRLAITHQEQAHSIYINVFGPEHQLTNDKLNYLNELRTLQK
ncbi:MAG: FxSxx-COOH system tetratricopeptide repeat protein [Chloroflexota bacterium]